MSDFKRPRGICTAAQIKGFELMLAGAVIPQPEAGVFEVLDGIMALVLYFRQECRCNLFRGSRPQMACHHIWAVNYTVEPPDQAELETLRQLRTGELLKAQAAQAMQPQLQRRKGDLTNEDIAEAKEAVSKRGGYKRFAASYDEAIRSEFPDSVFFTLKFFEEVERMYVPWGWWFQEVRGRKRIRMSRMLFAAFIYTTFGWSVRRTEGFLRFLAHPRIALIPDDYPDFDTLSKFLRNEETPALIRELIGLTAEPFRDFDGPMVLAADGTGTASDRNKFFDYKSERIDGKKQTREGRPWWRAHVACCVDTFVVLSVRVTGPKGSEKNVFRNEILPELESRDYDVEQFLLDGGFNSTMIREEIIEKLHAIPLCPWAKNSRNAVPKKWRNVVKNSAVITELHRLCTKDPEKFKEIGYRYRVKIEALFSSVKERYGAYVRTNTGTGPETEIMLKFLAHNIHVLLLAAKCYNLNIEMLLGDEDGQDKAA